VVQFWGLEVLLERAKPTNAPSCRQAKFWALYTPQSKGMEGGW